jgi:hypothetical protein
MIVLNTFIEAATVISFNPKKRCHEAYAELDLSLLWRSVTLWDPMLATHLLLVRAAASKDERRNAKQRNREKHRNRKGIEVENIGLKKHRNSTESGVWNTGT